MTYTLTVLGEPEKVLKGLRKKAHEAHKKALVRAIVLSEKYHKEREWLPGGGKANPIKPHPTKLRVRTGTLKRSYTRDMSQLDRLIASYGSSGVVYAPVHEYGSPAQGIPRRPGVENTAKWVQKIIDRIFARELKKAGL